MADSFDPASIVQIRAVEHSTDGISRAVDLEAVSCGNTEAVLRMVGEPLAPLDPLAEMQAGVLPQGDGLSKEGAVLALTRDEARGFGGRVLDC